MVEAHLGSGLPTMAVEQSCDLLLDSGVSRIHQTVEALALPAERDVDCRAHRRGKALDVTERHSVQQPTFDTRYDVPRRTGTRGQVVLAPTASATQEPDGARQVGPKHPPMVQATAYHALTARLRRSVASAA